MGFMKSPVTAVPKGLPFPDMLLLCFYLKGFGFMGRDLSENLKQFLEKKQE
jgi:hypothetical protein